MRARKKPHDAGAPGKKGSEPQSTNQPAPSTKNNFPIVGIGASAGGLEAFTDLLRHLPPDSGLGFVLVQHLDPQHKSALSQLLARVAKHPYVASQPQAPPSAEEDRASATAHEDDDTPLPPGGHGSPATGAKTALTQAGAAHPKTGEDSFKKIILLLRNHSGVNFSLYKSSTIQRRINRRVVLSKLSNIDEYATFLRGNTKELDALYSDVLISVTSFFRNPEAFDLLKRKVFPRLLQQRAEEPVRVWVLGCSTGQEAYSIAMAFLETTEHVHRARKLQVFATDLNEVLLDKARHGLYAKPLAQDVSPARLRRFFVEEEGGFAMPPHPRRLVRFQQQFLCILPNRSSMVHARHARYGQAPLDGLRLRTQALITPRSFAV